MIILNKSCFLIDHAYLFSKGIPKLSSLYRFSHDIKNQRWEKMAF